MLTAAGAEDGGNAEDVRDEEAEEDGPEDVFDVGEMEGGENALEELRVAEGGRCRRERCRG